MQEKRRAGHLGSAATVHLDTYAKDAVIENLTVAAMRLQCDPAVALAKNSPCFNACSTKVRSGVGMNMASPVVGLLWSGVCLHRLWVQPANVVDVGAAYLMLAMCAASSPMGLWVQTCLSLGSQHYLGSIFCYCLTQFCVQVKAAAGQQRTASVKIAKEGILEAMRYHRDYSHRDEDDEVISLNFDALDPLIESEWLCAGCVYSC